MLYQDSFGPYLADCGNCMNEVQPPDGDGVIEVRHWGEATATDVRDARSKVATLIEQTGVREVLVDLRDIASFLDTVEIYELVTDCSTSMRVAMLIAQDEAMHEDFSFLETVAVNRGYDVSMHTTRQEALRWLRT